MLTVTCVLVKGNVPYSPDYVVRLKNMVRRNLKTTHRFVCLTDEPDLFSSANVETIQISTPKNMPGWWAKLELFNPAHDLGERTMNLDLDTIVVGSLDGVAGFPSRFALVPPAGNFAGRGSLRTVRRYNSSVMVWDRSDRAHLLYKLWTPAIALRLWGDQDFIGEVLPDLDTMPLEWFPRLSEIADEPSKSARVVLCKVPKNHIAAAKFSWIAKVWR